MILLDLLHSASNFIVSLSLKTPQGKALSSSSRNFGMCLVLGKYLMKAYCQRIRNGNTLWGSNLKQRGVDFSISRVSGTLLILLYLDDFSAASRSE